MPDPTRQKASTLGASITLNTWGTDLSRRTGIAHALDTGFFRGKYIKGQER